MLGGMRTLRILSAVACQLVACFSCFGLVCISSATKEQAENEFAATLRTVLVTTNEVRFQLAFVRQGRLRTFSSTQLQTTAKDGTLVSKPLAAVTRSAQRVVRNSVFTTDPQGKLSPETAETETVVVDFSIAPADLSTSQLTLYYKIDGGFPPYEGIALRIADFIKPEPNKSVEPTRALDGARGSP